MSRKSKKRFLVTYARTVIMEKIVEARYEDEIRDEGFPGVYDAQKQLNYAPEHVRDIMDDETIWEIQEIKKVKTVGKN